MAVGDFNLDGKPDLATANAGSDNVTILLGDGMGGFTRPPARPSAWGLRLSRWRWATSTSTASPTSRWPTGNSDNVTILLNTCSSRPEPGSRWSSISSLARPATAST